VSDVLDRIAQARVVPVVRERDAGAALERAERLVAGGHRVVELTATTAGWQAALAEARERWPWVLLGAGTLRTGPDAQAAVGAGAGFLVSAFPAPEVRAVAGREGVPLIEGGFTPAEVAAASERGAAKLFPAHIGGPAYVRSLLAVLPGAAIVPTGGIRPEAVEEYLTAGAIAVGINADRLGSQEEVVA
jgi:2-dehydro-3-deoxyphosphogluconate aldolase/(4S)-4-hydroxy-2-oxoglutarate aldolase